MKAVLFKIVCLWLLFINLCLFLSKKQGMKTPVPHRELQKQNTLPSCIMKIHLRYNRA